MDGVDERLIIGAGTEIIAGEGLLITAGGLDTHIHFISPAQAWDCAFTAGFTSHDWRGHGAGRRNQCHHLYAGTLPSGKRCWRRQRESAGESGVSGEGKFLL